MPIVHSISDLSSANDSTESNEHPITPRGQEPNLAIPQTMHPSSLKFTAQTPDRDPSSSLSNARKHSS